MSTDGVPARDTDAELFARPGDDGVTHPARMIKQGDEEGLRAHEHGEEVIRRQ